MSAMAGAIFEPRSWVLDYQGELPTNQNGSDSPWRKRGDRKKWRANAIALAHAVGLPLRELVKVRISGTIYRRNLLVADRPGDLERLKSVIDGLVSGQFLPDDGPRFVEYGEVDEAHGPRGFRLVLEELASDEATATRAARRYARSDELDPLEAARRRARPTRRADVAPVPARATTRPAGAHQRGAPGRRRRRG